MNQRLVNLGCGRRFDPNFVNIDIASTGPGVIAHDLSLGIPLPDHDADVVYSAAVLEHLWSDEGDEFLSECFRVLKPGGMIRVGVPDFEALCRLYLDRMEKAAAGVPGAKSDYDWLILEMFDQFTRDRSGGEMMDYLSQEPLPGRDFVLTRIGEEGRELMEAAPPPGRSVTPRRLLGFVKRRLLRLLFGEEFYRMFQVGQFRRSGEVHRVMYDRYSLGRKLAAAGFCSPRLVSATESAVPHWADYHLDTLADGTVIKPDLFFMEAVRPKD